MNYEFLIYSAWGLWILFMLFKGLYCHLTYRKLSKNSEAVVGIYVGEKVTSQELIRKMGEIFEKLEDLEAIQEHHMELLCDLEEYVNDLLRKATKPTVIRGKYKPRMPKSIEHKKNASQE
jgi:hypothetical protein